LPERLPEWPERRRSAKTTGDKKGICACSACTAFALRYIEVQI
jgi:hypothetical protein